jgi:hypothetical protein
VIANCTDPDMLAIDFRTAATIRKARPRKDGAEDEPLTASEVVAHVHALAGGRGHGMPSGKMAAARHKERGRRAALKAAKKSARSPDIASIDARATDVPQMPIRKIEMPNVTLQTTRKAAR